MSENICITNMQLKKIIISVTTEKNFLIEKYNIKKKKYFAWIKLSVTFFRIKIYFIRFLYIFNKIIQETLLYCYFRFVWCTPFYEFNIYVLSNHLTFSLNKLFCEMIYEKKGHCLFNIIIFENGEKRILLCQKCGVSMSHCSYLISNLHIICFKISVLKWSLFKLQTKNFFIITILHLQKHTKLTDYLSRIVNVLTIFEELNRLVVIF